MVVKPFLCIEELHGFLPSRIKEEKENQKLQKKIDKLLKEFRYYEHCDAKFGEICKHPRCIHASFEFKNGQSITFSCGRLLDENKL